MFWILMASESHPRQCFSKFYVHLNYLGILLSSQTYWFNRSKVGSQFSISNRLTWLKLLLFEPHFKWQVFKVPFKILYQCWALPPGTIIGVWQGPVTVSDFLGNSNVQLRLRITGIGDLDFNNNDFWQLLLKDPGNSLVCNKWVAVLE